jgi:hypothetical protein
MLKIEDFMNPELEKLCPISKHSGLGEDLYANNFSTDSSNVH